jgi:Protein kinase domain
MHTSLTRNAHEEGTLTALEPSGSYRGAVRWLRLAVAVRAAIGHPNLLTAWVIGEGDGRLFVAFERCRLRSLSEVLAAGPLEPAASARVLDGAASGVDALTRMGLVARDLTPQRVLIQPAQGGVLMDLGIPPELLRQLPLEQDQDRAFRSPEELRREPVDARSSVYSLGALLFTALTGVPPNAGTGSDIDPSHPPGAPSRRSEPRSELPPEIDAVVARAMAVDPAERYADAKALARAATAAADLAPTAVQGGHTPNERRPRQPSPKRAPLPSRPKARPTTSSPPPAKSPTRPRTKHDPQRRPVHVDQTQMRPAHRPRDGLGARLATSLGRCVAFIAGVLVLAGAAGRHGQAWLRRITPRAAHAARETARVALEASRRGAHIMWAWLLRAGRLVVALGRSGARLVGVGAVLACVAGRRAIAMLLNAERSVPSLARGEGGRIDLFARGDRTPEAGVVTSRIAAGSEAGPILFGSVPARGRACRSAPIRSVALSSLSDRKVVLPAVGAIVASALCGIVLRYALEPEGGPSSITRSGLTVQLPSGWKQAQFDPGRPALSSVMAAVPSGETEAGFVVGKLRPQAAAARMLERVQREGGGRTQVRLGGAHAWRYAGLRPRPHLVGTAYLLPITGGAVLMLCHASRDEARVRLAECDRAASTLVVRGERPRRL